MTDREQIKSILVATDFSESAEAALAWAVEVGRPHEAKLFLTHAILPIGPVVAAPEVIPLPPDVYEADLKRCEKELAERCDRIRAAGASIEARLVIGSASQAILEVAEKCGADLIVAGTRGQTGMTRVFLGSTAAMLVRRAKCPVLTVHKDHAHQHRPIRCILVPTDYSDDAELALCEASRVLAPVSASARVVLLHVFGLQPEAIYPWTPSFVYRASEFARETRRRLSEAAEPIRQLGFDVEIVVREGYPPDLIDKEAKRVGANLIAMGTHGRSGLKRLLLGSVAERVLPSAPCPVLTVHREV